MYPPEMGDFLCNFFLIPLCEFMAAVEDLYTDKMNLKAYQFSHPLYTILGRYMFIHTNILQCIAVKTSIYHYNCHQTLNIVAESSNLTKSFNGRKKEEEEEKVD